MNMTVAIIGLGAAARNIHIPAAKAVPGLEIVAGLDPEVNNDRYPFPVFRDVESLFHETGPQAVIIAPPTDSRHALCIEMLERGCHVIGEKPFTETLEQAYEIVDPGARLGLPSSSITNSDSWSFIWLQRVESVSRNSVTFEVGINAGAKNALC